MPYMLRNTSGDIVAVSHDEMKGAGWERCDGGASEYLAYLETAIAKEDKFRDSDIGLVRVLEDLVDLLIERDFIRFTDFPEAAQKRMIERQGLRSGKAGLDLIDEKDGTF